jgi:hypothetical protein
LAEGGDAEPLIISLTITNLVWKTLKPIFFSGEENENP